MYTVINNIKSLLDAGSKFCIENDRVLYKPVYETIEKFCAANNVVIGGTIGTNLLLQQHMFEVSSGLYIYDLYTPDTFNTAKSLADAIYLAYAEIKSHVDASTVCVESKIKHKMFVIWIDARPVANVYSLDKYRDVSLIDVFEPVKAKAEFIDGFVPCANALSLLMHVYRQLYTVYTSKKVRTYTELLVAENRLYDIFTNDIKVVGGRDNSSTAETILRRSYDAVYAALLKEFASGGKYIITGDVAAAACLHDDTKVISSRRLQILTSESAADMTAVIAGIIKKISPGLSGKYVTATEYNLKIPTDVMLLKHTFTLSAGEYKQQILEMFNSPSYELVPVMRTKKSTHVYAGWFCLMRFRLIDIYTAQLMSHLGSSAGRKFDNIIDRHKESLDELRTHVYTVMHKDPLEIWSTNPADYSGVAIDDNILMKKISADTKYVYTKYYSALKFRKTTPTVTSTKQQPDISAEIEEPDEPDVEDLSDELNEAED